MAACIDTVEATVVDTVMDTIIDARRRARGVKRSA
jgi:hypothetical protein